jgi:precorrin-6A/cobalt-precorrin-6A reductase
MTDWLRRQRVRAVIDATHPFAAGISDSAAKACPSAGVPLIRLERPGWRERPGDRWYRVGGLQQAADLVPQLGSRTFLTTGRHGLGDFRAGFFLIRCVEPPRPPLPPHHEVLLARGPYTIAGELQLIDRYGIDLLVTKDSGGRLTEAKLDAARARRLPVIVVERPKCPDAPTVTTVHEALDWAKAHG